MNKLTRQLLSLFLCVLMVIESGFNAGITGYATEHKSGSHISVYAVKALASLPEDVAYQTVEYGTPEKKLNLPKSIFALACDEEAMQKELENEDEIYVASISEFEDDATSSVISKATSSTTASESEVKINISADFMTDEQKDSIVELLSQEEMPSIKDLEKKSGLDLDGYRVIKLPLSWESDTSFGGHYNPEEPGVYSFGSEVIDDSKYVLYDSALPTISVEVLEENSEPFSATWNDEDEDLLITVSAPAGVFPNDAVLKVEKIKDENDTLKIDEAVEKTLDNDKSVKQSLSYDIKVVDAEGKELKPVTAGGKKVDVTFKSQAIKDASQDEDQYVSVYHFKDVDKDDVERAAKANGADESAFGFVLDALSSLVSDKNTGDKLKKPEHMDAEDPEETAISEAQDITEKNAEQGNKKAPASDDSEKVSADGDLTIKTTDFSVYTIAIYSNVSPVKAYYITLANKDGSKYSYEEGDTLAIEFKGTTEGTLDGSKAFVPFTTDDEFRTFVETVSQNPTDLQSLLENAPSLGSTLELSADTKTFGIVADSDGISVKSIVLTRNGNDYAVTFEDTLIDSTETITHEGVYWEPEEELYSKAYYVQQTVEGVEGSITYELSGFGSDGGKATVSEIDKDDSTQERTLLTVTTGTDTATFTVDAANMTVSVKSTDTLSIKPVENQNYSFTPDNGGAAVPVSEDAEAPTSFIFTTKDHVYVVNQTVNYGTVSQDDKDHDFIDYKLTGLTPDKEFVLLVDDRSDTSTYPDTVADADGNYLFTLKAGIASFSVIAKSSAVELSYAENSVGSSDPSKNSVNNLVRKSGLDLSETSILELVFDVIKPSIIVYDDENKQDITSVCTAKFENLQTSVEVTNLYEVPDNYRFAGASLKIGETTIENVKSISNFSYTAGDSADAVSLSENATLTLHYIKLHSYPVMIETECVSANTDIKIKLDGLNDGCVAEVYLLDSDMKKSSDPMIPNNGLYTFKTGTANAVITGDGTSKYYLLVMSSDKDLSVNVVNEKGFQQHAEEKEDESGDKYTDYGKDPLTVQKLKEQTSETDHDGNVIFIEGYKDSISLRKRWEDGGKNYNEKKALIGGEDLANHMSLQYRIEDATVPGVDHSWKNLTVDDMKNVIGFRSTNTLRAITPKNASANTQSPTSYTYTFWSKLYSKYVYRDTDGTIKTADIQYRIAEDDKLKDQYYSMYEDENQNNDVNGTVLRNYQIKTFNMTVKWNDKDARKDENGNNLDRPSISDWLDTVYLHKVIEGNTEDAASMSFISKTVGEDGTVTAKADSGYETIKVTPKADGTWALEIRGFGYDKNDHDVHYYLTENPYNLSNATGKDGNEIINRRYEPSYENVDNPTNYQLKLFKDGTLVNILTGDTKYTMYKIWKDDPEHPTDPEDPIIKGRPKAKILVNRYVGDDSYAYRHYSPIQNADYQYIVENIGTAENGNINKYYQLTVPKDSYFDAYNGDGAEFRYIGKEKTEGGSNSYETSLYKKDDAGNESYPGLTDGYFIFNGETLVNRITGKVTVTATKTWQAKARADVKADVTLALYRTHQKISIASSSQFEEYADAEQVGENYVLGTFSSEQTTMSHTWTVDKYDGEGKRLYYFVKEVGVATEAGKDAKTEGKTQKTSFDGNSTLWDVDFYKVGDTTYFVTADGYRYIQDVSTNRLANGNVETTITNRLVGNAQVKLIKSFPNGLSSTDQTAGKPASFSFDVFQSDNKIGTITKVYKAGTTIHEYKDGNLVERTLDSGSLSKPFSDVIIIDSFTDSDIFELYDSYKNSSGLLPRYDMFGAEYTYTIFEHELDPDRGYFPTVINTITEPVYTETSVEGVKYPYIKYTDKYLLDTVSISNGTGEENYVTVFKEWLDGDESDKREAVSFVLEYKAPGLATWSQIGDEYTIDPKASEYSKYVFIPLKEQKYRDAFKGFRTKEYKDSPEYGDFRVRETKLGGNEVHYYTGAGKTISDEGEFPNRDYYLGHDWKQYEGKEENFAQLREAQYEKDDYGFVQGSYYDYDVLLIDSETAGSRYKHYLYNEPENDVANRNFDFALSNVRVGVIYINIEKTWEDGRMKDMARPDSINVDVHVGDKIEHVPMQHQDGDTDENKWTAKIGPLRKYDDEGKLINYSPKLVMNSNGGYEEFVYSNERATAAELYRTAYVMSGNTEAELKLGADHHTGDVYSIKIHNKLSGTITPVVNKYWEDSDEVDNKRPPISSRIYRSYVDESGFHAEQIDKDKYIDYDWNTQLDKKAHNWWQETYKPLRRFSDDFYEYTYYIGEVYNSQNTNEYSEIGAFPGSPSYKDGNDENAAVYDYNEDDNQELELDDGTKVYAAKVTLDPEDAGTLVNRPRNKRTVSGVKIFDNLPDGYSAKNLPDVKVWLYRKVNGTDINEQVPVYDVQQDYQGSEILVPSTTSYLSTVLKGSEAQAKRNFKFYNFDFEHPDGTEAYVPKYDDKGRPYRYYIVEDGESVLGNKILKEVYDFSINENNTLTNGIEATNGYKDTKNYNITFYKNWDEDSFKARAGSLDDKYLDPDLDPPYIHVRLYRYLQKYKTDDDGNLIKDENGEPVLERLNETEEQIGNQKTVTYDKKHKAYSSYTWTNLEYYAPNLLPYKYVVSEKSDDQLRPYTKIYEAKLSDDKLKLEKINKDVNLHDSLKSHKNGWSGYDVDVNVIGEYDFDNHTASGEAAIINEFEKIDTTELTIKKLWDSDKNRSEYEKYDNLGLHLLPSEVKFKLYRIKYTKNSEFDLNNPRIIKPNTYHEPVLIEDIKVTEESGWTTSVSGLLKYEPRGFYYRYYLKEDIPEEWKNVFIVETRDEAFWNGGIAKESNEEYPDGLIYDDTKDDQAWVTGRKNVFKTISLQTDKAFKNGADNTKIDPSELKILYKHGVIPDEIKYQVYYQIQDGKSKWLPLTKSGNAVMMSTSKFNTGTGKYSQATIQGLLPYTFDDASQDYIEVKYRAVEYSVKYKNGTEITRSDDSIAAELGYKEGSSGFAGFTAVSSTEPEKVTTGATEYLPYKLTTTVTNTLDLTELQVEKTWNDEAREFGSKIKSISFKLQRRLKESNDSADWKDVEADGVKTIEREASEQKARFTQLPLKDSEGQVYEYRAVETKIVLLKKDQSGKYVEVEVNVDRDDPGSGNQTGGTKAYTYESENSELSGYYIYSKVYKTVFTNKLRLGSIVVTKRWEDSENRYKKRPEEIMVKLISSIGLQTDFTPEIFSGNLSYNLEPKALNSVNNWTASWSELPLYDADDEPVTYTLKEYMGVDGEEREIYSYDATYLLQPDENDEVYEGSAIEELTVDDKKPTKVEFVNTLATTSFIVEKKWDSDETDKTLTNDSYKRFVRVELQSTMVEEDEWSPVMIYSDSDGNEYPNGKVLTATLSELNQYKARWDDLPAKNKDGRFFRYRAVEKSITTVVKVVENGQEVTKEITRDVTLDSERMNRTNQEQDLYYVGGYNLDEEFYQEDDDIQQEYLYNILKKGGYSITKVWDDDNNRDGIRPDEVTFHLQRRLGSGEWTTLDPEVFDRTITNQTEAGVGAWTSATWSELPVKDPSGESYSYRAVEAPVPDGYELRAETGELTWYETIIEGVNNVYHWIIRFFTNLLNGTDTVEETVAVDEGTVIYEDAQLVRTYSNVHNISTVDVSVKKDWSDNEDKYGDRPESIEVTLYQTYTRADGTEVEELATKSELANGVDKEIRNVVTLSAENNWTYTWTDLPEYKRGLKRATVSYIVRETPNDNYSGETTTTVDTDETSGKKTFNITIKNTLNPTKILITKNWENEYSGIGKTVTGAEVVLQRKTEATDWTNVYETVNGNRAVVTRVISKPETSIIIDDLPVADKNGLSYQYRAVESRIYLSDGSKINAKANANDITSGTVGAYVYTSKDTEIEIGFSTEITNRMDTASLKVSKTWNDEDDKNKKRPENLKITLKASTVVDGNTTDITVDGLKTETTLNAGNNWTDDTTWKTVPVYTADGKRIYYTFTEESITSYNASYRAVSFGAEAVTGDGVTAARVYTETDEVSEVTFTNSYRGGNGGGGGGGGGDGGRGGETPGGSDSTDDGEVLGGNRPIPEEPEVLGGTRPLPQTGDNSNMMLYGLSAIVSMAVLAAWFYVNKKRKKSSVGNK